MGLHSCTFSKETGRVTVGATVYITRECICGETSIDTEDVSEQEEDGS